MTNFGSQNIYSYTVEGGETLLIVNHIKPHYGSDSEVLGQSS